MKRYDLQVVIEGVAINYAFPTKEKRQAYINTCLDCPKPIEIHTSDVDVIEQQLQR